MGHSADPVYVLLRQSASDKFPYVTYLLGIAMILYSCVGFGFLIGIPTFLVYFSVGMVAIPIADILISGKKLTGYEEEQGSQRV